jgi:hypothetical protein
LEWRARNPDVVRLVGVFDPHLTPNSPASFKGDYYELAKETLRQVFRFCEANEVDAIIWAGDIFHLKAVQRNPLWFINEVLALIQEPMRKGTANLGIAGNHDFKFGTLENLKGQPLENLIQAGAYQLLDHEETVFKAKDFSVRVAGGSYHHGLADHVRAKTKKGADFLIAIGHFWFGTETGELFGERIYSPDWLQHSEVDAFLVGHHHEDQGVRNINGKWYDSHGAISRTGSHANDLTRRPAASFIEVRATGIQIKLLRPKVPDANAIIDLETRAALQTEKKEMEEFLANLRETQLTAVDPKTMLDEVETTPEVRAKAQEYLELAETRTP